MSGVKAEPLTLAVALAHYTASLPNGKSVPLEDISRDFGYPVKDVRDALEAVIEVEDRDLTTIADIAVEDGRLVKYFRGGYEREFRRTLRLSPVQARAALLALDLVSHAADPNIIAALRNKVLGAVTGEVYPVEVGEPSDEDLSVTSAIEKGRRENRLLEIRYPSGKRLATRTIEPHLMSRIEGVWYLNAYCRHAEAARLFRLERILSARILEESFEPREREEIEFKTDYEDIDPRTYAARRATVRFSPEVARWMDEHPELDFVEGHKDGSADYVLYYTDASWAAKRVLQYLGEAVVLEPEELRNEIYRQASSLLESYGQPS